MGTIVRKDGSGFNTCNFDGIWSHGGTSANRE